MRASKSLKRGGFLCVLATLIIGCTGYSITGGPGPTVAPPLQTAVESKVDLVKVNSLVVLPLEFDTETRNMNSDARAMYDLLERAARTNVDLEIVSGDDVWRAYGNVGTRREPEELARLGRKFGGDAVLVTKLNNYTERQGSRVGAEAPAVVGFTMSLLRVSDAKEIWSANYHFQEEALSDNLFRIEDRLGQGKVSGWRSANDLLTSGFEEACHDLSERRLAQFSRG